MSEYEKVHFDNWQDLAKAVIDGAEIYFEVNNEKQKILFSGTTFNFNLLILMDGEIKNSLYIKKQPTLEELIPIKPRLCWVWWGGYCDERKIEVITKVKKGRYYNNKACWWENAAMLTDDEIKQFLNGE